MNKRALIDCYHGDVYHQQVRADVAHMTIPGRNIVGQLNALTEGDGFSVRIWGPNGTHEHGGGNLTAVTLVVRFDKDDTPVLETFDFRNRNWAKL